MKLTGFIFIAFSLLSGILLFAIWSNVQIYAQQQLSQSPSAGNGLASKSISRELKSKMCDPSNPSLKVVNTTEARICGIPKTVKPPLASAGAPQTSAVSSPLPSAQQTVKPTAANITAPKQQHIVTTNAVSPSTQYVTWITIASLSNLNISSPSSAIAPQLKSVNQQQQLLPLIPIAAINRTAGTNGTTGQNYTFAATSPAATSDQLLYLGYHGDTKSSHGNSGSKHDDSTDNKPYTRSSTRSTSESSPKNKDPIPFTPSRIKIVATDNDSIVKKKSSSTKADKTDSAKPPKLHNTKTTSDVSSTVKKKTTSSTKLIRSDTTSDKSNSKDNSKSDTKLPHIRKIISTDSSSSLKKKTKSDDHGKSKYNGDSTDTTSSPHKSTRNTYDSSPKDKTKSDPKPRTARTNPNDDSSDATSSSHKKSNSKSSSIIENDIPSVIMKNFNPKHSTDSGSEEGGDSFFGRDKFFSDDGYDGF